MKRNLLKPPKEDKIHVQMDLEGDLAKEARRLMLQYGYKPAGAVKHLCIEAMEMKKRVA